MAENDKSNFNVVTTTKSGKGSKTGLIIAAIIILFVAISVPVGVYLVKQQQNIREKAQALTLCPEAEQCPVPTEMALLKSCDSIPNGEPPAEISCNTIANVGTTALCGGVKYYCPTLSGNWVLYTVTPTPIPTPTPTPTPIPTVTPSPTSTASASATPTASSSPTPAATATSTASPTAAPIPVTGISWPTIVGAGIGIFVIVGSILLAL